MVKWTTLVIIAAVIIVAVIGIKMLASPSVPSTQSNTESAASANTEVREGIIEIEIRNLAFNPAEIKIKAGSKLTWVNYDSSPHTVSSDSGEKTELNSEMLAEGDSYGHTFDYPGVYNYHCSIQKNMKGKVVVV